jgi:hypothetical protein
MDTDNVFFASYRWLHLQAPGCDAEGVHYTVSVDLYSAGVVMCELAARHLLVEVEGSVPAPTHPDVKYTSASSMIRDGLAVLRSLPGALATGGSARRALLFRSLRLLMLLGCLRWHDTVGSPEAHSTRRLRFDGSQGDG